MRRPILSWLIGLVVSGCAQLPCAAQTEPRRPDRESVEAELEPKGAANANADAKQGAASEDKDTSTGDAAESPNGLFAPYLHGKGGVSFKYLYTGDFFDNMRGGLSTDHATAYRGNLDMVMKGDAEKLGFAPGGNFFLYGQTGHGYGPTRYVGDYQIVSNIDAPDFVQVSEYWYDRSFFDKFLTVRIGKQDCNAEFAVVDLGGDFINSSFGQAPTIPMPTFPANSMAVVTFFQLTDRTNLKVGVWDGTPKIGTWGFSGTGATFTIAEIKSKYDLTLAGKKLPGDFHLGGWYHSGTWASMNQIQATSSMDIATVYSWRAQRPQNGPQAGPPSKHAGDILAMDVSPSSGGQFAANYGMYLGFDQLIFKETSNDEKDNQGLGVFGQAGWNPQDRNISAQYLGAGLVYRGLLPSRNEDTTGVGIARVAFTDELPGHRPETVIEAFYKAKLTKWATLQPDMQYIAAPGGTHRDAFLFGLRYALEF